MAEVLGENEMKIIEILINLGLNKQVASTLVYLSKAGKAISKEIEAGAGLRQPEVSVAIKEMKELGWVKETDVKKKGKGRPMKVYELNVEFREIVKQIIEKKRQELEEEKRKIDELEKMLNEI